MKTSTTGSTVLTSDGFLHGSGVERNVTQASLGRRAPHAGYLTTLLLHARRAHQKRSIVIRMPMRWSCTPLRQAGAQLVGSACCPALCGSRTAWLCSTRSVTERLNRGPPGLAGSPEYAPVWVARAGRHGQRVVGGGAHVGELVKPGF